MENLKELFGKLVEHEVNDGVGAAESMSDVWTIIKDWTDPFSNAIKNVIIERMTDIRRTATQILRFHREVFSGCHSGEAMNDQLIDFLAAQEKQIRIAEKILREDLSLPTES